MASVLALFLMETVAGVNCHRCSQTKNSKHSLEPSGVHLRLWQPMRWIQRAEIAADLRNSAHCIECISTADRAARNRIISVQFEVGCQVRCQTGSRVARFFPLFQCPFGDCAINLMQIVDASVSLRGGARVHKTGNGNRRQDTDNGHNDHDFHQREARHPSGFGSFHIKLTFSVRRELRNRRVIMITIIVHSLPAAAASAFQPAMPMPESSSNTGQNPVRPPLAIKKPEALASGFCLKQQTRFQLWQLVRRIQRAQIAAHLRSGSH